MKGDTRRVYFYDVEIDTNKQDTTPPSMLEVAQALQAEIEGGNASLEIDKGRAVLFFSDVRLEQTHIVLYARISDKSAPDVRFSNHEAGTSRVERKREGEGRDFGNHICISLEEVDGAPNTYLCLIEKNTGLHRAHINRLLQATLRNLYRRDPQHFTCDHTGGARDRSGTLKRVNYRPMLELKGHPSESFIDQLERGALKEFSLIHSEQQAPLGGRAWLEKEEKILRIKARPSRRTAAGQLWDELTQVFAQERANGYETARIKFHSEDTNKTEVVTVETGTGSPIDDRFVKSIVIGAIDPELDESYDQIVEHFSQRLEAALLAEVEV